MKKQIFAIISTMLISVGFTACSGEVNISDSDGRESSDLIESTFGDSSVDPFGGGDSQGSSDPGNLSSDFDYDYVMTHRFDNVIKQRGVYGETEIPDIHYENADSEGCVTHSPYGDEWQYFGLESMEFERLTLDGYTIKLIGNNVRTDKENFPDRIFVSGLQVEIEKDGAELLSKGFYSEFLTGAAGAMFFPENYVFKDKLGSYLDAYELEYPVIAMSYYFADNPNRRIDKNVDFCVIKDGECLCGFAGICEPGCGVALDRYPVSLEALNIPNGDFETCRAALFEADEFRVIDERTLFDETAGITYTFDFKEHPVLHSLPFELYTAEKNVGSVAAAGKINKTYS